MFINVVFANMSPARARSASKSSAEVGLGALFQAPTTENPERADLADLCASVIEGTSEPTTIGPSVKDSASPLQSANSEGVFPGSVFSSGTWPTTTISRSPWIPTRTSAPFLLATLLRLSTSLL